MDIRPDTRGHLHPLSIVMRDANAIFGELGFTFSEGPEMETIEYNFDRLNVPKDHPSRDMQDTFYIEGHDDMLLRTHTSPVQIRFMETHEPPLRAIVPGKVFRNEATDATHEAQFFQIEGLMIDESVSMAHLKGTLEYFFSRFFGGDTEVRFRPSFFPFVEPGLEVDMRLTGTRAPEKLKDRWVEVMGAGMVHPNVLKNAGINAERFQGFAFGMGLDRLAIMRYGVPDIRAFYNGDLRLINQF